MGKYISVRISDQLQEKIDQFCAEEGCSRSWFITKAIADKLEDWQDFKDGVKKLEKHLKTPNIISHENLIKELGIEADDLR